jgi:ABC-type Na+ transport system ATPase subunit NatA
MRNLAESGMTVLLSSHILGEIQLICDQVTIISAGDGWRPARSPTCSPSTPRGR